MWYDFLYKLKKHIPQIVQHITDLIRNNTSLQLSDQIISSKRYQNITSVTIHLEVTLRMP